MPELAPGRPLYCIYLCLYRTGASNSHWLPITVCSQWELQEVVSCSKLFPAAPIGWELWSVASRTCKHPYLLRHSSGPPADNPGERPSSYCPPLSKNDCYGSKSKPIPATMNTAIANAVLPSVESLLVCPIISFPDGKHKNKGNRFFRSTRGP